MSYYILFLYASLFSLASVMWLCKSEVVDRSSPQMSVPVEKVTFYKDNLHTAWYMPNMYDKHYDIIILKYTDKSQELDFADIWVHFLSPFRAILKPRRSA